MQRLKCWFKLVKNQMQADAPLKMSIVMPRNQNRVVVFELRAEFIEFGPLFKAFVQILWP